MSPLVEVSRSLAPYLFGLVSGLCMGVGWWYPGSITCALLGWVSTIFLLLAVEPFGRRYGPSFLAGCTQTTLGFYWLCDTIRQFGGFDSMSAGAIFTFFVAASSIQNLIFVWVLRNISPRFHRIGIAAAIAWVVSETISIRIFPWFFAHTQLAFHPLAQSADFIGARWISFLMFWNAAALIRFFWCRERRLAIAAAPALLAASVLYGLVVDGAVRKAYRQPVSAALVQANISVKEKGDIRYFEQNTDRYIDLTEQIAEDGMLVIWPETVIQDWIYSGTTSLYADPRLPRFEKHFHLLTGALTFSSQELFHNSAVLIRADGSIPAPYHKQILMPFGEYMPFSALFPSLKELNPQAGDFAAGSGPVIFRLPYPASTASEGSSPQSYTLATLICYEDVVGSLARDAVRAGAEILVNLTNDAWFGASVAPEQHNLIATFRAIENRRYLLRSTNSGLTTIISPFGETLSRIPPLSEGSILASVHPIRYNSVYTLYTGEMLWWALAVVSLLICFYRKVRVY